MILQAWHGLSDPKMEEALKVRMDFIWFTGFDIAGSVPDETSICRFRSRLIKVRQTPKQAVEPIPENRKEDETPSPVVRQSADPYAAC